jgi:hypothetical protein
MILLERVVMYAVTALKSVAKRLDEVALVVEALVAKKLVAVADVNTEDEPLSVEKVPVVLFRVVMVAEAEVSEVTVPVEVVSREIVPEAIVTSDAVVVASAVVPVAVSVPATRLEVVAFVATRLVNSEVAALKSEVKKDVVVAEVARKLVVKSDEAVIPPVVDALVR